MTPWTGDRPTARPLPSQDNTNIIEKEIVLLSEQRDICGKKLQVFLLWDLF
jgi:hypothetical protein